MHIHLGRLALLITFLLAPLAEAKPQLLVSLKPIALIAKEVAGADADVQTLLPVTASHHDYPLKTSDYARLKAADLVVWVGPELESFLQKPLAGLPPEKVIAIYSLSELNWPAQSLGEPERDPHVWLDPRNAVVIAEKITQELVRIDPQHAAQYRKHLQMFATDTRELDSKIAASMTPLQGKGFAVYHEGYSHFVQHYGLLQLGYVTFTPEQKPGAKHLHQLREKLVDKGKCLFLEPQNDQQSSRDLAQELHLKLGQLDIIGNQSVTRYAQLMEQIAAGFSACLADGSGQ